MVTDGTDAVNPLADFEKELKPVHDWVKDYERFWTNHLDRIKERAEQKTAARLAQSFQEKTEEK